MVGLVRTTDRQQRERRLAVPDAYWHRPMTRFVVDATVVIHLVTEGLDVAKDHELVAPTLIRSQVLSLLHESVARGELDAKAGLAQLQAAWRLPIRLLGDAVLRRRAWDLATTLGWDETYQASPWPSPSSRETRSSRWTSSWPRRPPPWSRSP